MTAYVHNTECKRGMTWRESEVFNYKQRGLSVNNSGRGRGQRLPAAQQGSRV